MMKIALASDHAGLVMKQAIARYLENEHIQIHDFGTHTPDSCDYPDYAHPLALAVEAGEYDFGIIVCGSGNGINMTANKHQGIRSALCWMPELAQLARAHNNANVLALPARFIAHELAIEIVEAFLNTLFEGGRHQKRVNKIPVA
ncbi:MAG: ribose 5-phosphate isomerase B [Paludibacteraceae bacterium]|nr:ribose 5-phosphate isomerase B [Paludibacteraceae bacterium]